MAKDIKATLLEGAAVLTAAVIGKTQGALPIDPGIADPNVQAANVMAAELMKIYYGFLKAALESSGQPSFDDPQVPAGSGSSALPGTLVDGLTRLVSAIGPVAGPMGAAASGVIKDISTLVATGKGTAQPAPQVGQGMAGPAPVTPIGVATAGS